MKERIYFDDIIDAITTAYFNQPKDITSERLQHNLRGVIGDFSPDYRNADYYDADNTAVDFYTLERHVYKHISRCWGADWVIYRASSIDDAKEATEEGIVYVPAAFLWRSKIEGALLDAYGIRPTVRDTWQNGDIWRGWHGEKYRVEWEEDENNITVIALETSYTIAWEYDNTIEHITLPQSADTFGEIAYYLYNAAYIIPFGENAKADFNAFGWCMFINAEGRPTPYRVNIDGNTITIE